MTYYGRGKSDSGIYEAEFLGFSYGFRPRRSQHDALDALVVGITGRKVNYILDADIRSFFDSVDQEWLVRFMAHRISDRRIIRLIQKWLRAGVLEDGVVTVSETGTGQGSVISPLLANIYLYYVFDLWAERWRRREATGDMIMVRYADDLVVGFQNEADAQRFREMLRGAVAGVLSDAASGKDPSDRIRPLCRGSTREARAQQTGNLQLPWLHLHLRKIAPRSFPAPAKDQERPNEGKAQGRQRRTAASDASVYPRTRKMAEAGCHWLFCLPCGAHQQSCTADVPEPHRRPMAAHAPAAQPEGSHDVATDQQGG
jgi:hypothetical protein